MSEMVRVEHDNGSATWLPACDYCGKALPLDGSARWVAAGGESEGEMWHQACWEQDTGAVMTE